MVLAALQLKEEKLEKQRERLMKLWDEQQKRIEKARRERKEMQNLVNIFLTIINKMKFQNFGILKYFIFKFAKINK